MIGYRLSRKDLEALIEADKPKWLKKAAKRAEALRKAGTFQEKSSIWSEVKPVYMRLQGDCKCAYCERKLEAVQYGKGEQDVEHFRPKSAVRYWQVPQHLADLGIAATGTPEQGGYHLLAYDIFNYCASCKPCNSILKSDFFPIAGGYDLAKDRPELLLTEEPYLIYPIGDFDKSPEDLIRFHGVSPQSSAKSGHDRARALVTIEFFKLDDQDARKNLFRERAMIICALYPQLKTLKSRKSAAEKKVAKALVEGFTSPRAPHTNCARCFRELFATAPAEAEALFVKAGDFVLSTS